MPATKLLTSALALSFAVGLAFAAEPTTKPAVPYPLKTCLVTDEELGEMGTPVVIQHDGREIKFCCGGCVKKFNKDPAKYLKKLDGPAPTTKPD